MPTTEDELKIMQAYLGGYIMMTTKEKIEIMQAYLDGKIIQSKITGYSDDSWKDLQSDLEPTWFWDQFDYRIKPQSEYRAYKDADEFVANVESKALPGIWVKETSNGSMTLMVTAFNNSGIWLGIGNYYTFYSAFLHFKYIDGSPFGMKSIDPERVKI